MYNIIIIMAKQINSQLSIAPKTDPSIPYRFTLSSTCSHDPLAIIPAEHMIHA